MSSINNTAFTFNITMQQVFRELTEHFVVYSNPTSNRFLHGERMIKQSTIYTMYLFYHHHEQVHLGSRVLHTQRDRPGDLTDQKRPWSNSGPMPAVTEPMFFVCCLTCLKKSRKAVNTMNKTSHPILRIIWIEGICHNWLNFHWLDAPTCKKSELQINTHI